MGRACFVPDCKKLRLQMIGNNQRAEAIGRHRHHRFPQDPILREKWLIAMKCEDIKPFKSNYPTVCCLHFKPQDHEPHDKRPKGKENSFRQHNQLKKHVVPSIFSWTTSLEDEKKPMAENNVIMLPEIKSQLLQKSERCPNTLHEAPTQKYDLRGLSWCI